MTQLTEALDRILNWAKKNYDEPGDWRSGLTDAEIEEKTIDLLPLKLPLEVYELYQWRDGCLDPYEDYSNFYSSFIYDRLDFLHLDEAILNYQEKPNKNNPLFPIFYNEKFWYTVVLSPEQKSSPIIITRQLYQDKGEIIAPNLTTLMIAQAEYLESEADYLEICQKYNCQSLLDFA